MAPSIPVIKITHHADTFRIWCPHREQDAGHFLDGMNMGTQDPIGMAMPALIEQVQIVVRELWRKTIGIVCNVLVLCSITPYQVVVIRYRPGGTAPFEQVGIRYALQANVTLGNGHLTSLRHKHTHQVQAVIAVLAKYAEGIVVACLDDPFKLMAKIHGLHSRPLHRLYCSYASICVRNYIEMSSASRPVIADEWQYN